MQDGTCSSNWESSTWSAWFTEPYYTQYLLGISSSIKEKTNSEERKSICFLEHLNLPSRSQLWNGVYESNFQEIQSSINASLELSWTISLRNPNMYSYLSDWSATLAMKNINSILILFNIPFSTLSSLSFV